MQNTRSRSRNPSAAGKSRSRSRSAGNGEFERKVLAAVERKKMAERRRRAHAPKSKKVKGALFGALISTLAPVIAGEVMKRI